MQEVNFLFVGDFFWGSEAKSPELSLTLEELISEHDFCCLNFEGSLAFPDSQINKPGEKLTQLPQAVDWVNNHDFNIVNLGNNHSYDYGDAGLLKTMSSFKWGTVIIGAGSCFHDAYELKVIERNNLKIGLLSFCEAEYGVLTEELDERGGIAWINHSIVNRLINNSKRRVDFLVVCVHAGIEQIEIPLPEWRARYKELVDFGADVIVGNHPHLPQGFEFHSLKPIFYSLGNFYFDLPDCHPYWSISLGLSLQFSNSGQLSYKLYNIRSINGLIDVDSNVPYINSLCSLLNSDYLVRVNQIAENLWNERYLGYYKSIFMCNSLFMYLLHSFKSFFSRKKINEEMLFHNIRIESHLWLVRRYITNKLRL